MPAIPIRIRCSGTCAMHCTEQAGHRPRRGDEVEAWLRNWREQVAAKGWITIDAMLDDYRFHADTGTPLNGDGGT